MSASWPLRLEVDPDHVYLVVDLLLQGIDVVSGGRGDADALVRLVHLHDGLQLPRLGQVDLVDGHDGLDVDAVACEDVEHLLHIDVLADDDGGVDVAVGRHHVLDGVDVDLGQLERRL
jgi:hypothetical protein